MVYQVQPKNKRKKKKKKQVVNSALLKIFSNSYRNVQDLDPDPDPFFSSADPGFASKLNGSQEFEIWKSLYFR